MTLFARFGRVSSRLPLSPSQLLFLGIALSVLFWVLSSDAFAAETNHSDTVAVTQVKCNDTLAALHDSPIRQTLVSS